LSVCNKDNRKRQGVLRKKGRNSALSDAQGVIAFFGYRKLGISGRELTQLFDISRPALSKAINRGEKIAKEKGIKLLS